MWPAPHALQTMPAVVKHTLKIRSDIQCVVVAVLIPSGNKTRRIWNQAPSVSEIAGRGSNSVILQPHPFVNKQPDPQFADAVLAILLDPIRNCQTAPNETVRPVGQSLAPTRHAFNSARKCPVSCQLSALESPGIAFDRVLMKTEYQLRLAVRQTSLPIPP